MNAGSAVRKLSFPEDFLPAEGFTVSLDELHARVLVLDGEIRCAVLVLEMTSLPPDEIETLNRILKKETGAEHCFSLVTHTFSAPHFLPDHILKTEEERNKRGKLQSSVHQAVQEAAREAVRNLHPITMEVGTAPCAVNSARDVETPMGWWIANNGSGAVDHTLTAVRFADQAGHNTAVLVHYPIQSSVLDGSQRSAGGKAVSGDLAGVMASSLEKELNCPVLFLIGAAGDQAPRQKAVGFRLAPDGTMIPTDMRDEAIPVCRQLGEEMATAALEALKDAKPVDCTRLHWRQVSVTVPAKKIERDLHKLHPTRIPPYEPEGESVQTVELLQIGDLKLIGVKPELNCVTAKEISGSDPMVKVVTLWNGGAKYMADAASCDRITYEAQNSPFMKGAAELLAKRAGELLAESDAEQPANGFCGFDAQNASTK